MQPCTYISPNDWYSISGCITLFLGIGAVLGWLFTPPGSRIIGIFTRGQWLIVCVLMIALWFWGTSYQTGIPVDISQIPADCTSVKYPYGYP
jgi:hypothetical protein